MRFPRVFILSPAHCGGERARLLLGRGAKSALAMQLRSGEGTTLGEAFTFISELYFRGKMAYADACANPPGECPASVVITTNRGLVSPRARIGLSDLRAMARGEIDARTPAYRRPLERDAQALAAALGGNGRAILLGSVASGKYCDILLGILGPRLLFPQEFVGLGDMSRGGLMLRCVRDRRELAYLPVLGATRNGRRPPRLQPLDSARLELNRR